jgi:foldase protein PrsA
MSFGCQSDKVNSVDKKDPEIVIATVNDQKVYLSEFVRNFKVIEYSYNQLYGEDIWTQEVSGKTVKDSVIEELLRNMIIEKLVVEKVSAEYTIDQALIDEKYNNFDAELDKNETMKEFYTTNDINTEFIKQQLVNQFMVEYYKQKIGDELKADEAYIQSNVNNYIIDVNASHILIDTIEGAQAAYDRIAAGEEFAAVAKELSLDPGSKETGGELGNFKRGMMVQEFEDAAFALEIGQVSEPVKSQFGYHIIKVNGKRTLSDLILEGLSADEIKENRDYVVESLISAKFNEELFKLESEATIEKFIDKIKF